MRQKKVYYAHCMAIFNTPQEVRDILMLEAMGFEVHNPNNPTDHAGYQRKGMEYFRKIIQECDIVAFRAYPDFKIPAGIFKEVQWAIDMGKPVIELPAKFKERGLTVEATVHRLREAGQR